MNKLQQYPDYMLIEEANNIEKSFVDWSGGEIQIEKSFVDWSGGEIQIDQELENRYLDIAEEIEQYEEYQQFDNAILSLEQ